jgi:uncharacterized protein
MSQIAQLLELFRVDKSIRGLRSRLDTAERFLAQQKTQLADLDKQSVTLEQQLKQLRATLANDEGEAARLEARISTLREQMNIAKTSKEYNAFLTELNTLKDAKTKVEETVLVAMQQAEHLTAKSGEVKSKQSERTGIATTAQTDRDASEAAIRDRLSELSTQRTTLAEKLPPNMLKEFERLVVQLGDDAMAPLEVLDRRNHEYSCGGCMMALPMETVNAVVSARLTHCPTCRAILFTEEDLIQPKNQPKSQSKKSKKETAAL